MREIKFRIYIKNMAGLNQPYFDKIGRMFEVELIDFENEEVHIVTTSKIEISLKDVELMQYTGIKDKNAKKIYEGDIVRVTSVDYLEVKWGKYSIGPNGDVQNFYVQGPYIECKYMGYQAYQEMVNGHVEVIGNIYEDSDTLNPNF